MSEKVTVKVERNILHLPAIALRGLVVFPNNLLHFEVGRDKSIAAVEWAVRNKSEVFLIAQKDMKAEDPKAEEMYQYGVVAEIKQVMRVSDDLVRILVEGKFRAKRTELDTEGSFLLASVRPAPVRPIKAEEETEAEALLRNVKTSFDAVLSMNPRISKDVVFAVTSHNDPAFLCEYIPANLLFRFEDKQAVMEESTLIGRLRLLVERLHRERRMLEIDKEIAQKVDEAMDKNQRDYYLHEQMHMISQELGEDDDTTAEAEEYRRRIQELHLDEEREKKLLKEVEFTPLCSPALLNRLGGLAEPADLLRTNLLHLQDRADWSEWFRLAGLSDESVRGGIVFSDMNLAYAAVLASQGVVMGDEFICHDAMASGLLVRPFDLAIKSSRSYMLVVPPEKSGNPAVAAFCDWLHAELPHE